MLNNFKKTYCMYIVQLIFKCKSENELLTTLDKIIDKGKFKCVSGDSDIKQIFEYICSYRLYDRNEIYVEPQIPTSTLMRATVKSIF